LAVSKANVFLSSQLKGYSRFWIVDQRDPFVQYYNTIAKFGGLVQAPKNITTFGCLRAYIAAH
jgi:hypothetical protein